MKRIIVFLLILTGLSACKPDVDFNKATSTEEPVTFVIPQGWPQPFFNFENNALTQERFQLGRKLFYDGRLSRDNTISCGTCHQSGAAYAHADHDLSHGIDDLLGKRNSPTIFNLAWSTSFFWDGGVNHIESQPINPIQNPVEMDESLQNIIDKLNADSKYRKMFKDAWGTDLINSQRIFKSIAQFMGVMVSATAKYDKVMRNEAGVSFTGAEQNGYNVFKANCASCHKEPLFTDFSFRNNGLISGTGSNEDSGRAIITQKVEDLYKFKIPSLRNLGYSQPYMHDGRLATLDAVLNHYESGIHITPSLDPLLQNGIKLTAQERSDLLAFLKTLDDEEFIKDTRFHEVQ
ncbi:MAG: cytochrome c peroxidase [Flavipsychrobacter sp.]